MIAGEGTGADPGFGAAAGAGFCTRSWLRRASWSKTSASVVFASPLLPLLVFVDAAGCIAGADGARGG